MTNRQALAETKKIIQDYGWTQGEDTGYCILGALGRSVEELDFETGCRIYGDCTRALREQLWSRKHGGSVCGFNDDPRTTLEDVYALIDEAIERVA